MQNKKKLHKHLLAIYIIYFAALVIGFVTGFMPEFSRGCSESQQVMTRDMNHGGQRTYYVTAPLQEGAAELINIPGLPENIKPVINTVDLRVTLSENYTLDNAFRVIANNGYAYLLTMITMFAYLAIFVMIALIINSLRKSIRDEQPLGHRNITLTRIIGALILVAELSEAAMKYLNHQEAARLLAGTPYEVVQNFPVNYWNIIVGVLFLFMAEVFSIGTQLSEEQKLTI